MANARFLLLNYRIDDLRAALARRGLSDAGTALEVAERVAAHRLRPPGRRSPCKAQDRPATPSAAASDPPAVRTAPAALAPYAAKVLTIRQPWAAGIVAGLKTVEYRSWPTRHRGPLYIHAAARRADAATLSEYPTLGAAAIVYGAIIGVVDLADVEDEGDGFAWVLENPRKLAEPFQCKGALSLWTPPAGLRLS